METGDIPIYVEHPGTIRISGGTLPKNAGKCAVHYLQRGVKPLEFLCIGGNANQQATKAMGVFRFMVEHSPEFVGVEVAFQPFLYLVPTMDESRPGHQKLKSATVWRTLLLKSEESSPK